LPLNRCVTFLLDHGDGLEGEEADGNTTMWNAGHPA